MKLYLWYKFKNSAPGTPVSAAEMCLIFEMQFTAIESDHNQTLAMDIAAKNLFRQPVKHEVLDDSFDGSRTELRIIPFFGQICHCLIGK